MASHGATPPSPPYAPAADTGAGPSRRPARSESLKRRAAAWLAADAPGGVTRGVWVVVAVAAAALLAAGGGATTGAREATARDEFKAAAHEAKDAGRAAGRGLKKAADEARGKAEAAGAVEKKRKRWALGLF